MRQAVLIGFLACVPLHASGPGTTSAQFLKIGVGPRAVAMGEAQVGLADDVYAAYWNPAGLARLEVQEAGFVQNQHLENISEQFAAYAYPNRRLGTFAGSLTYLQSGNFQGYDAVGQPTGSIDASDTALAFSHARTYFADRRRGSGVAMGVTGKYIREKLDSVSAGTYAGDVGVLLIPGRRWGNALDGWKAGAVLRNLGDSLRFDSERFELPRSLATGLSYTGRWRDELYSVALDGQQPQSGPASFGGGLEILTLRSLILRAGYTSAGDLGNGLRVGGGLRFKTLQVDYAYAGAGEWGAVHRFGLTLRFGKLPEDSQRVAQRHYDHALRTYRQRRYTDALVEFNKVLEVDPSHPDALKMMNQTYEEIKSAVPD